MPSQETIYTRFQRTVSLYPDNEALAVLHDGRYEPISYRELDERVRRFAFALVEHGFKTGDKLGILVDNSVEWVTADLACAHVGIIVIPLHTSYNEHYVEQVITHSGLKHVVVSGQHADKLAKALQSLHLERIYLIGSSVSFKNVQHVHDFHQLIEDGNAVSHEDQVAGNAIHTIVYTSGTTGTPKGVMLSHANLLSNIDAMTKAIPIFPTDRFFSFLPLSHILERTAGLYVPLLTGAAIYYARSPKTLAEDMRLAKPTIVLSVPRVFERAHEKILAKFSKNTLTQQIANKAMRVARACRHGSATFLDNALRPVFDKLVFTKVREAFGGRLRLAVSGGAALPMHIGEFFDGMGIPILEGYGLTETAPVVTVNTMEHRKFGTVGKALDGVSVRISQNGEILVKGPNVMRGYYAAEDLTKEVIDVEGWFHTGDIGSFDEAGFLTIIGRLKEMIVLSTGRNIFPVPIEQELEESPYIKQAMVYGDAQRHISAFIVPDFNQLKAWCEAQGIHYEIPAILTDAVVLDMYRAEITKCLVRMQSFEQVEHFKLLPQEFTVENDMMTMTLKLRRNTILSRFIININ